MHLRPPRLGILLSPGMPRFRIEPSLHDEIVQRATIILQIEDAIALIELEIRAVELAAMRQAGGKVALRHFCVPNFGLELVERVLRIKRARNSQGKGYCPQNCAYHFPPVTRGRRILSPGRPGI